MTSGEMDHYASDVKALLDQLQLELTAALTEVETIAPRLLGEALDARGQDEVAGAAERTVASLTEAAGVLASLRARMVL